MPIDHDEQISNQHEPNAKAVIDAVRMLHKPQVLSVRGGIDSDGNPIEGGVIAHPSDITLTPVKQFLHDKQPPPDRRKGVASMQTLASFCDHVNRHKADHSAIFASYNRAAMGATLEAVLDYNSAGPEGEARYCEHRTIYRFPFSQEWRAWAKADGESMSVGEFAEFLEDRIADVREPSIITGEAMKDRIEQMGLKLTGPAGVLTLSRGLSIRVETKVGDHQKLESGESKVFFEEKHTDEKGGALNIPSGFPISIPVFEGDDPYVVLVRLRYRKRDGTIKFSCHLSQLEAVFMHAFQTACATAQESTGLDLFYGSPE